MICVVLSLICAATDLTLNWVEGKNCFHFDNGIQLSGVPILQNTGTSSCCMEFTSDGKAWIIWPGLGNITNSFLIKNMPVLEEGQAFATMGTDGYKIERNSKVILILKGIYVSKAMDGVTASRYIETTEPSSKIVRQPPKTESQADIPIFVDDKRQFTITNFNPMDKLKNVEHKVELFFDKFSKVDEVDHIKDWKLFELEHAQKYIRNDKCRKVMDFWFALERKKELLETEMTREKVKKFESK